MSKSRKISARDRGDSADRAAAGRQAAGKREARSARLPVAKTYKLYIDGRFPRSESGRYYALRDSGGAAIANICRSSRKDFRDAVVAARQAFAGWSQASPFLRGQILYRTAEMLEGRSDQFVAELALQGVSKRRAQTEVARTIDRLVYYAGWSDKYQQVFSAVNPVSSSHFNFSVPEPMGVVGIIAPLSSSLLGFVSVVAPAIVGGNTCVVLASHSQPLCAVSLAEVLHAADVPAGVINVLTGVGDELMEHFASHMDVNAVLYCEAEHGQAVQQQAALNIKRVISRVDTQWQTAAARGPYLIMDTQEIKTTWHPIGG
jgi:acyl-CoA reductase-like NAD-dependent aldehyde dehydrogenase